MGLIPDLPEQRGMRRVVVVVPSAFTLANLFFGIWAMVSAANGNFVWAGWFIVFSAVLDMLDGRIARASNAGSKFGAELDSLVDVISFGVAPAMLMYFLEFAQGGRFGWVLCFIYVAAAAIRLARYNVLAATRVGTPGWFSGMPSPAAGCTLATYYAFSQTPWYQASLAYLDLDRQGLAVLMLLLAVLMVSQVKYPRFPAIGVRSAKGLTGLVIHVVILGGGLLFPRHVLFPLGLAYLCFGAGRHLLLALSERREVEPGEPGEPAEARPAVTPIASRRRAGTGLEEIDE